MCEDLPLCRQKSLKLFRESIMETEFPIYVNYDFLLWSYYSKVANTEFKVDKYLLLTKSYILKILLKKILMKIIKITLII